MNKCFLIISSSFLFFLMSCSNSNQNNNTMNEKNSIESKDFKFLTEQFSDIKIMRYQVPDFEKLSLNQKEYIYYLSEAALWGRDITFDQNFKYNLFVRRILEEIYAKYNGDRNSENFKNFVVYLKRVWFSNGIHHHYSTEKIPAGFDKEYLAELINNSADAKFPIQKDETKENFIAKISDIICNPETYKKRVFQDPSKDLILNSSNNFYEGVNQNDVEKYYSSIKQSDTLRPLSLGINSKLMKENGKVVEHFWKKDGMYGKAIEKIIYYLDLAKNVAENDKQKEYIAKLISYYTNGDLKTWDEYNILWAEETESLVDFVNGFIEVYGDPLGRKATWESVVNFKNLEATKRTKIISDNAQWFEDNSPVDEQFKKKSVKGISAKVITVVTLGGDCYPSTPIGINLPNADWIRKEHGSKSVTMENITYTYDQASMGNGSLEEFAYSAEEIELAKKYGPLAGNIHTDLHECLGHASGQLLEGVSTEALKNYHSTLEEARADLFALYYMMDNKMIELGLFTTLDFAKSEYNSYIKNGLLVQLTRVNIGKNIEESHMRNRQLISKWCYEKGAKDNVIEKKVKNDKTYFVINDYNKLRNLFGELLKEIQRIKSTGDYESGKNIVETFGVLVDLDLHKEVKARYEKLNLAPYGGFINPKLTLVKEGNVVKDVKIEYPDDYSKQMLEYSEKYSVLPDIN
ncbi:MAG: dihydrofolate reductase [Bacteroidetes bacterium GWA2_30_7]|nr:MAG: dihydrofolate reductase [Bacteroidetes bacterium GWA2_30_7]